MPISLGTTTVTALFLGTTSISSAYLGNTQVFGGSFTPLSLFSGGAQGVWLDPSDLSTMFSDRAGTTPVTAPGTVVGLRLDKSKGLTLGSELVVNGDFASSANWTISGGASISGGQLVFADGVFSDAYQTPAAHVAGKTYLYEFDLTITSGTVIFRPNMFSTTEQQSFTTSGRKRFYALTTGSRLGVLTSTGVGIRIDNISVKELPGNHATAPTDAARPIYGVEPKGGRRNLLTWSEDFGNAVWVKNSASVSANAGTAPDGTVTADRVQHTTGGTGTFVEQSVTATVGSQTVTVSGYVRSNTGSSQTFRFKCTHAGVADYFSGIFTATSEWQRFSFTQAFGAGGTGVIAGFTAGAVATDLLIWGAQLELGSTATAYQRVTTAYDVTESGVDTCHYVQYDGSDDSMSTAAINFTGTDKMSVFAGVRKLSDAASSIVAELSIDWANNAGAFAFTAPDASGTAQYGIALRGSGTAYASMTPFAAPITKVVTQLYDIGASTISTELAARVNGSPITLSGATGSAGAGNFGNYPMFFGRRNNATLPFNGKDYGLIVVGKAASAGEITDTETWLAARTAQVTL